MSTDPTLERLQSNPDYARLVDVMTRQDALASLGLKLPDLVGDFIDPEVLAYIALARSRGIREQMKLAPSMSGVLASQFMNAFALGVKFEKEGGHRDGGEAGPAD